MPFPAHPFLPECPRIVPNPHPVRAVIMRRAVEREIVIALEPFATDEHFGPYQTVPGHRSRFHGLARHVTRRHIIAERFARSLDPRP